MFLRIAALAGVLALAPAVALADAGRPFTVVDSIGFSSFVFPGAQYGQSTGRILRSPDGRRFLAVTSRGDLANGKRVATVWVFEAVDVEAFLAAKAPGEFRGAKALTTWSTGGNEVVVSQWRWSTDSQAVLFLGSGDDDSRRLVRVDLTGRARTLSAPGQDVTHFDERAGEVAYLAHPAMSETDLHLTGGPGLPDIVYATGQNILPLLAPNEMAHALGESEDELWTVGEDGPRPVRDGAGKPVRARQSRIGLSPDGRHVMLTRHAAHVGAEWERYRPREDYPGLRIVADKPGEAPVFNQYRPQSYVSVDLASGEITPIVDAPVDIEAQFYDAWGAWSPDGRRIALIGVYPALSTRPPGEREILPCDVGVAEVGGRFDCLRPAKPRTPGDPATIDRPKIVGFEWSADGRALKVRSARASARDAISEQPYALTAKGWVAGAPRPASVEAVRVTVREDIDVLPAIVARRGAVERVLLDPNPQLRGVALGAAAPYSWRDPDGDRWTGVLVRPADFAPGRRYPLVIQTHGVDKGRYLVDGPAPTGFSARALAGRGFLVLQVQETDKAGGTPQESPAGAEGYRSAIRQLAAEGLVDPARVGIIGWSHYGPYVMQGLVDHPEDYKAASFAESAYNSYDEYLFNIDYMGTAREAMMRAQVGPKPFGPGLKVWTETSAGFRTDRVCTPIFWQANNPTGLLYSWGSYAALRAQEKPIELLYLRNGEHALVKPLERLVEQGMNVDWFDYWLNDRRDPDPGKVEQYRRWDRLRALPRCGDSKSAPAP